MLNGLQLCDLTTCPLSFASLILRRSEENRLQEALTHNDARHNCPHQHHGAEDDDNHQNSEHGGSEQHLRAPVPCRRRSNVRARRRAGCPAADGVSAKHSRCLTGIARASCCKCAALYRGVLPAPGRRVRRSRAAEGHSDCRSRIAHPLAQLQTPRTRCCAAGINLCPAVMWDGHMRRRCRSPPCQARQDRGVLAF